MRRHALVRDTRGAAMIEFAIVAPVLLLFVFGGLDAGHTLYVKSILEGELQKAARDTSLESASDPVRRAAIQERVRAAIRTVMTTANVQFRLTSFHDYLNVQNRVEDYNDANHDGMCNNGEGYVDANNNNRWDLDTGTDGVGGSKDVVQITATVTYPRIINPMLVTGSPTVALTASTLLRNQPASDQNAAPMRQCS